MDINQIKYFVTLAETENMARAQEILHIAQPALSAGLKRMENQLGVALFDRVNRRLELNEYGRVFLRYAKDVVSAFDNGVEELSKIKRQGDSTCDIVIANGNYSTYPVTQFLLSNPEAVINTTMLMILHGSDYFNSNIFDLIITPLPEELPDFEITPLYSEHLVLMVPKTHPLFLRQSIDLKELNKRKLYTMGHKDFNFGQYLDKIFRENNIEAELQFVLVRDLPEILRQNNAVGVVFSTSMPGYMNNPEFAFIPFKQDLSRQTGIAIPQNRRLNKVTRDLYQYLIDYESQFPFER